MKKTNLLWIGMVSLGAALVACGDDGGTTTPDTDAGVIDSGVTPPVDAGPKDSGVDATTPDSGPKDAGPADSGAVDSGVADSGPKDAGPGATCSDNAKNGAETDVDCGGGACPKCADTKACAAGGDCVSGVCTGNVCQAPACGDGVKNGAETDVDCGGACATKCGDTKGCAAAADCASGVCTGNVCQAPACGDGVKNGTETDLDCGGACATKCAAGGACAVSADCASGTVCTNNVCAAPTTCKALLAAQPGTPSGVYALDPDGAGAKPAYQAYCDMVSDGGGWTLALKADGTKQTFTYNAALWQNTTLLATDKPDLDANEAKLASWNEVAFNELRVALVDGGVTRAAKITHQAASLNAVFGGGVQTLFNPQLGRATWKGLMAAGSLQPNCNREGFSNIVAGYTAVRIGILSNQENDCGSPDSWLGIGGTGAPCGPANTITTGNVAGCTPDNGDKAVAAFGYVFVR